MMKMNLQFFAHKKGVCPYPDIKIYIRLFYWITIMGRIYQEKFVKNIEDLYSINASHLIPQYLSPYTMNIFIL